jgi:hypothetical protein
MRAASPHCHTSSMYWGDLIKFLNLIGPIIFVICLCILYFIQNVWAVSGAHPASHSMGIDFLSMESNDRSSPQSSTEFENEWSYTSIPPTCLHMVDRKIFTFTFTFNFVFIKLFLYFVITIRRDIKIV